MNTCRATSMFVLSLALSLVGCGGAPDEDTVDTVDSLVQPVSTAWCRTNGGTYFPETGYCIYGRILKHWMENGGLEKFGYPISEERWENVEGYWLPVQYFQRQRLEIQTGEVPGIPSGTITYGRIGAKLCNSAWNSWCHENYNQSPGLRPVDMEEWALMMSDGAGTTRYSPSECELMGPNAAAGKGQWVCGEVLRYWRENGGLAYFGYPVTKLVTRNGCSWSDQTCILAEQVFERARIEIHPYFMSEGAGPQPGYIMLGLLTCIDLDLVGKVPGC